MTGAMMLDRAGVGVSGMGAMGVGTMPRSTRMPGGMNMMMAPRGTIAMEKCTGGMKMTCRSDDKAAAGMIQNLCTMLAGGMCSCCSMMNGMPVCYGC
jgi:hypothetical protein